MVGVVLNTGAIYDMYSLIADAPYDDTSANVNGLNSYELIYSSGRDKFEVINSHYETQFSRYYETGSTGD